MKTEDYLNPEVPPRQRLPILGELVRLGRRGYWRPIGLAREGSTWTYVNRGIGMEGKMPPVRFGCRPEVTLITVQDTLCIPTPFSTLTLLSRRRERGLTFSVQYSILDDNTNDFLDFGFTKRNA